MKLIYFYGIRESLRVGLHSIEDVSGFGLAALLFFRVSGAFLRVFRGIFVAIVVFGLVDPASVSKKKRQWEFCDLPGIANHADSFICSLSIELGGFLKIGLTSNSFGIAKTGLR